jgi:hypothetical protein
MSCLLMYESLPFMSITILCGDLPQCNRRYHVGAHIFERRFDSACCTVGGPHMCIKMKIYINSKMLQKVLK